MKRPPKKTRTRKKGELHLSKDRAGSNDIIITGQLRITLMAELPELDDRSPEDSEAVLLKHAATEALRTVSRPKRRRLEHPTRNY